MLPYWQTTEWMQYASQDEPCKMYEGDPMKATLICHP